MRLYYVFIQQYEIIQESLYSDSDFYAPDTHESVAPVPEYKLLPWEYFGCVCGTRELYDCFYDVSWRRFYKNPCVWVTSFDYAQNTPVPHEGDYRAIVVDDSGNVRDFYELTRQYRKPHNYHISKSGGHIRWLHNSNERRQSMTPEDILDYKSFTSLPVPDLPSDRLDDAWDFEHNTKVGRSWKDQSRKHRQYGSNNKKLSRVLFDLDDWGADINGDMEDVNICSEYAER